MSEETCISQFQYLIETKFEGDVEELLHLLKSGGRGDVLVNQLAEYLMVSWILLTYNDMWLSLPDCN
jgi:hypothetical protein